MWQAIPAFLLHGKMKSAMYVGCLCVCVCVCVCVRACVCIINKICPLASVASFGDIAIIFSKQLGIVTLRRCLVFGGNPSKYMHAIRFRDILYKKATSRLTVSILATL